MIPKIFYINLDRRTDRNQHMIDLLEKNNLSGYATRVSAFDGKKMNLENLCTQNILSLEGKKDIIAGKRFPSLTYGALGCALSHYHVWKFIVEKGISEALILEDDVQFVYNFKQKLINLKKHFPEDYDIIFLGYTTNPITGKLLHRLLFMGNNVNSYFVKTRKINGMFGYILSNKGAKKLLDCIFPLKKQFDHQLNNCLDHLNVYSLLPNQCIIYSDISELDPRFGTDIQKPISIGKIFLTIFIITIFIITSYLFISKKI